MSSLRLFLSTIKSSKESSKVSFLIYTNLELSTTNYILLYILLSCVIFMTLLTVGATNSELFNFTIKWSLYYKIYICFASYKVCYTWFFYLNNLNKLFPTYCFIFYRSNKTCFLFSLRTCPEKTTAKLSKSLELDTTKWHVGFKIFPF